MKPAFLFAALLIGFINMGCDVESQPDLGEEILLFNKLQNMLNYDNEKDIDSVKKYLTRYENLEVTKMWNDWVHDSFAQRFIKRNTKDTVLHYRILHLISNDDYTNFSRLTEGLRIYLEAKKSAITVENISHYNKMLAASDESLSERYRILLFNLSAEKDNEFVLDAVITNSENILVSSDNNEIRAKYRFFIAHSYYLKAKLALQEDDEAKALQYFELANSFSPDAADRKVTNAYYYEIYLLDGHKDYCMFYNNQLLAQGDSVKALDNLSQKAMLDFSKIEELTTLYNQLHPATSFNLYWKKNLTNSLPDAPSFILESYNGDRIDSKEFKGKWIILDFWGTWCSPCREELPKIQNLSDKIKSELSDYAVVLTIACRDTPKSVEKFMKKSDYDFVALMSDKKVVEDFNVLFYPTKYLVTPNGQYFELYSNTDWEKIIDAYVFDDRLYSF